MLTNRRRAGFSSGVFVSTTTTISTFLRTSVPRHLHCFLPAWKRQNARIIRLHTLTCYRPATVQWRDTDWFKTCAPDQTQKRPHFIQSVNRPLPSTLHQRTPITQPPFSSKWVGPKAMPNSEPPHPATAQTPDRLGSALSPLPASGVRLGIGGFHEAHGLATYRAARPIWRQVTR